MTDLLLATRNAHKLAELGRILAAEGLTGLTVIGLADVPEFPEEPETAENRAEAPMLVCSSPPGSGLSQSASEWYILSVAPPRTRISPSRMYSGIDSST